MLLFDEDILKQAFDFGAFQRGTDCFRQGKVVDVRVQDNGRRITGEVRDNHAASYRQEIAMRQVSGTMDIEGHCSCPVGYNCKHVVAVLLAALQEQALSGEGENRHELPARSRSGTSGMHPAVRSWLEEIEDAIRTATPDASGPPLPPGRKTRRCLVYVLQQPVQRSPDNPIAHPEVMLRPFVARPLKAGGYGKNFKPFWMDTLTEGELPDYLEPADLDILRELHWAQVVHDPADMEEWVDLARLPRGGTLLKAIVATGRCQLHSVRGPRLQAGDPLHGQLQWQMLPDGRQQPGLVFADDRHEEPPIVLPLEPPCYLDEERLCIGALETDLEPALAVRLLQAPPLRPSEATKAHDALERMLQTLDEPPSDTAALLPVRPRRSQRRQARPVAVLRLIKGHLAYNPFLWMPDDDEDTPAMADAPLARLFFDYDGFMVEHDEPGSDVEALHGDTAIRIRRDRSFEQKALQLLREVGFVWLQECQFLHSRDHPNAFFLMPPDADPVGWDIDEELLFHDMQRFLHLSAEIVPWLEQEQGWRVDVADDYPFRILNVEGEWFADLDHEGSGIDWFSLSMGMKIGDETISLLPLLEKLVEQLPAQQKLPRNEKLRAKMLEQLFNEDTVIWYQLEDGRLLPLPADRLRPVLQALLDMHGNSFSRMDGGTLRLSPLEADSLHALGEALRQNDEALNWQASPRATQLLERLRQISRQGMPSVSPPAELADVLRPYQREGLSWLVFLRQAGFGGVLADDMGLGKTLQSIAFLLHEKQEGALARPALIVCPTSVLPQGNRLSFFKRYP